MCGELIIIIMNLDLSRDDIKIYDTTFCPFLNLILVGGKERGGRGGLHVILSPTP